MDVAFFEDIVSVREYIAALDVSHEEWACVYIEDEALIELRENDELLNCAHSVVKDYMKELEGKLFFCGDSSFFIIVRDLSEKTAEEIGRHLCNLVLMENTPTPVLSYFMIDENFQKTGGILSDKKGRKHIVSIEQYKEEKAMEKTNSADIEQVRTLLVDDDSLTRLMVRTALKEVCVFETVSTASNALPMYQSFKPDIVFLDIGLPDGNGQEILKEILALDPKAYIVMFSGRDDVQNISQSIDGGAQGFIAKPFVKDRLLSYVYKCVEYRKAV